MKTPTERARAIAERFMEKIDLSALMEMPDISCKKCGREIYCGVNKLSADPECEKKSANRSKE